ncbi:MAG: type II toxin-antitoxin system HigB family toxin [Terracidiphilus sp.]
MHIVTRRHLREAIKKYPDAASEIESWASIVEAVRWRSLAEVRRWFKDADIVDGYVIFNIRQNRYRLVTVIHYARKFGDRKTAGYVYIRSFLTHRQYDNRSNWDRKFGTK